MSKFYKCDICGKELSYGVGETARGLMWGKVQPAGPGVNAHVVYKKESEDFFLEDVCPDCMEKIIEYIKNMNNESQDMITRKNIEEFDKLKIEKLKEREELKC